MSKLIGNRHKVAELALQGFLQRASNDALHSLNHPEEALQDDRGNYLVGRNWVIKILTEIAKALLKHDAPSEETDHLCFYWNQTILYLEDFDKSPASKEREAEILMAGFVIGSLTGMSEAIHDKITLPRVTGGKKRAELLKETVSIWQAALKPSITSLAKGLNGDGTPKHTAGGLATAVIASYGKRKPSIPSTPAEIVKLIKKMVAAGEIAVRQDGRSRKVAKSAG